MTDRDDDTDRDARVKRKNVFEPADRQPGGDGRRSVEWRDDDFGDLLRPRDGAGADDGTNWTSDDFAEMMKGASGGAGDGEDGGDDPAAVVSAAEAILAEAAGRAPTDDDILAAAEAIRARRAATEKAETAETAETGAHGGEEAPSGGATPGVGPEKTAGQEGERDTLSLSPGELVESRRRASMTTTDAVLELIDLLRADDDARRRVGKAAAAAGVMPEADGAVDVDALDEDEDEDVGGDGGEDGEGEATTAERELLAWLREILPDADDAEKVLRDLSVTYVSGVESPAIDSAWLYAKSEDADAHGADWGVTAPLVLSADAVPVSVDAVDENADVGEQAPEEQKAWAPVLIPDEVDKQGDVIPSVEIEQAAHRFLADHRHVDTDHDLLDGAGAPIESWTLKQPQTFMLPDGSESREYPAGTWMMGVQFADEAWGRVKAGELTGFSIYGEATELDLDALRDDLEAGALDDVDDEDEENEDADE